MVLSWIWVENGKSFLWTSEKDGWMHIYKVSRDGKNEQLLTKGNFDADKLAYDAASGNIYFMPVHMMPHRNIYTESTLIIQIQYESNTSNI